jgi:hypothetical protein
MPTGTGFGVTLEIPQASTKLVAVASAKANRTRLQRASCSVVHTVPQSTWASPPMMVYAAKITNALVRALFHVTLWVPETRS